MTKDGEIMKENECEQKRDMIYEIFSNEDKGLGLKAVNRLVPGNTVLCETAFCHLLSENERGKRCDGCMETSAILQRCSQCKNKYYCSVSCQRQDWKIHRSECRNLLKVLPEKPPEICLLASRLMTKLTKLKPKLKTLLFGRIIENMERIVNKHDVTYAKGKDMLYTFACIVLEFIDENTATSLNIRKPEDCVAILGWLVCNVFSIMSDIITSMESIGIGIFDVASLLNHSCVPNCIAAFEGNKITIRVIKSVEKDEELTINYIEGFQNVDERQKQLVDHYFFICCCRKCIDDSTAGKNCMFGKCMNTGCNFPVAVRREGTQCECGFSEFQDDYYSNVQKNLEDLQKMISTWKLNFSFAEFDNFASLVESALTCVHTNSSLVVKSHEELFQSSIRLQKWNLAIKYGSFVVDAYLKYYPEYHPATGMHFYILGKIHSLIENSDQAQECFDRAKKIFLVTHGKDHRLTKELENVLVPKYQKILDAE